MVLRPDTHAAISTGELEEGDDRDERASTVTSLSVHPPSSFGGDDHIDESEARVGCCVGGRRRRCVVVMMTTRLLGSSARRRVSSSVSRGWGLGGGASGGTHRRRAGLSEARGSSGLIVDISGVIVVAVTTIPRHNHTDTTHTTYHSRNHHTGGRYTCHHPHSNTRGRRSDRARQGRRLDPRAPAARAHA